MNRLFGAQFLWILTKSHGYFCGGAFGSWVKKECCKRSRVLHGKIVHPCVNSLHVQRFRFCSMMNAPSLNERRN